MAFEDIAVQEASKSWFGTFADFSFALFYSPLFTVIKVLAAIYVTVLIVDLVLLLVLGGVGDSMRKNKRGIKLPTQSEATRKWKRIMSRLKSDNPNYYKAAILEADQFVEKVLVKLGYKGDGMEDYLAQLAAQDISSAGVLTQAHDISVRIITEHDFSLSHEEATEVLNKYHQFLEDMEIFG